MNTLNNNGAPMEAPLLFTTVSAIIICHHHLEDAGVVGP